MQFQENISLRPYNTFGIDAKARYFATIRTIEDLQRILVFPDRKPPHPTPHTSHLTSDISHPTPDTSHLILGGGSNILFLDDFDGLVIKNDIRGIEKIKEDENHVYIKAGAGENWHQFVLHSIENGWAGLENLSLIPGCVGASPMQNIGAYGVEIKDVFHELTAFHLEEKCNYKFTLKDCAFGYRDSVFKQKYKDQFVILNVTYRLNKQPVFHTSYGAINEELSRMGVTTLSIRAISQAVINIRSSKLPDPRDIGNAGSFFKNPSVSKEKFMALKEQFADLPGYENADGTVKLAAGWLIEHCGPDDQSTWKGYRKGDAGVHAKQALVLVNYGAATGKELYELSVAITQSVSAKYGVMLEKEVNIL